MASGTLSKVEIEKFTVSEGFSLSSEALHKLYTYIGLLTKWNKVMNLVGPKDWSSILTTLVIDSLYLATFLETLAIKKEAFCCDLGSGAGLPGIPLRVVWSNGTYWLIESREKRALFLNTVLGHFVLENTYVYHGRVEQFMSEHIEKKKADLIISRAFMPWKKLLMLVEHFMCDYGLVILLTKEKITDIRFSNWRIKALYPYSVAGSQRFFVAIEKSTQ